MIPDTSREQLVEALQRFDRELRDSSAWQGWQEKLSQKWAIQHDGKLYPPKQIISIASGAPVSQFSGGPESNEFLERHGLTVTALRGDPVTLREGLETILQGYVEARQSEPFGSQSTIAQTFRQLESQFRRSEPVRKRPNLRVTASYGRGNWANVPWIAFLDSRETESTQRGIYVVILFRQDGAGAYLTYNQGVTDPIRQGGREAGYAHLRARAAELCSDCGQLAAGGFRLDDSISLSNDPGLGQDYEASTIAHKYYAKGGVPEDAELLADLELVLGAYDKYLTSPPQKESTNMVRSDVQGHWLFQGNPAYFDIRGALDELGEMSWLVNQGTTKFKAGQVGFIWESGPDGGIVAKGTILNDPEELPENPAEMKFNVDRSRFSGARLRVRIRVDRRVVPPISRKQLLEHPILKDLQVLAFANATNYVLPDDHYEALEDLIAVTAPTLDLSQIAGAFAEALRSSHVDFGRAHLSLVRAFVASLAAKPFVILTGLSGSGKTQIALRFGEWIGRDRFLIAAVRPDWTGAEALFGYEDALKAVANGLPAWTVPEPLAFLLRAAGDRVHPYVLVLDEMNLAHVERYFADALSGMESGMPCIPNLVKGNDGCWRLRSGSIERVPFPENVYIIGTVNVDETTYMFSPKVLDRANTFEFRVQSSDLSAEYRKPVSCVSGDPALVRGFLEISRDKEWHLQRPYAQAESLRSHLRRLHELLAPHSFEFGHRVFYEATRFAALYEEAGPSSLEAILDRIVMQKILPRLHGSRRRLEPVLLALTHYCLHLPPELPPPSELARFKPEESDPSLAKLPLAFDKLARMLRSVRANQFTSFTE